MRFSSAKNVFTDSSSGFSLVELLVVISIISVLATIGVLMLNPLSLLARSRDSARLSDLKSLQKAIEIILYDPQFGGKGLCVSDGPCAGISYAGSRAADGTGWLPINFNQHPSLKIPALAIDPLNNEDYFYEYLSDEKNFELNAILESDQHVGQMERDSGDNNDRYEVGTSLFLIH